MGSGASTSSLPERLDESDVKAVCGDFFDQTEFDAIKDEDGRVSKETFISAMNANIEKEVFNVYLSYCQNSEIDSQTFGRLCRDAKLLNKTFTRTDAGIVFIHIKQKEKSAHTKAINFKSFRQFGITEMATKKGVDVHQILEKIARSEGDQKMNFPRKVFSAGTTSSENERLEQAAIKIQKTARKRIGRRTFLFLLKVKGIKNSHVTESDFPRYYFEEPNERQLHAVYNSFCSLSEMNVYEFVKLLKCATLLTKAFTDYLAQEVFKEGIAKAEACEEGGPIHNGILYGKRVRYDVFRRILLVDVAIMKKLSIEGIVAKVSVIPPPPPPSGSNGSTGTSGSSKGKTTAAVSVRFESVNDEPEGILLSQNSAAIIIQKTARRNSAKQKVKAMRKSSSG